MTKEEMERLVATEQGIMLHEIGSLFKNTFGRYLILGLTIRETEEYLGLSDYVNDTGRNGGSHFHRGSRERWLELHSKYLAAQQQFVRDKKQG